MNTQNLLPFLLIAGGVAYLAWAVARGRRWDTYQAEAANRSKAIVEASAKDRERLAEAISISREQLEVEKQLLSEIKGLREDLRRNPPASG